MPQPKDELKVRTDTSEKRFFVDELGREVIPTTPDIDEQLSCGLTRREIYELKKQGVNKPGFVPWAQWNGPKKLSHVHSYIIELAARGQKAKAIAEEVGMTDQRLSIVLNSPEVQKQIKLVRETHFKGLNVNEAMDQLSNEALQCYAEIMTDPTVKVSLKQKTAQDILDRKIGKPQQKIEHTGSVLSDVFKLLQKEESDRQTIIAEAKEVSQKDSEIIDVVAQQPQLIKPENNQSKELKQEPKPESEQDSQKRDALLDPLDNWLDEASERAESE